MLRKVEISNIEYLKTKSDILENTFIERLDVNMNQIEVENLKSIKINHGGEQDENYSKR